MTSNAHRHREGGRFLAVMLPLAVLAGAAVAQGQILGTIRGLVRDDRGIPQVGAAITLLTARGAESMRVRSDFRGAFVLKDLIPGDYSLRVALDHFLPITKENIQVLPGGNTLLDVNLRGLFSALQMVRGGSEIRDMSDNWKWMLRTSMAARPVLRFRLAQRRETRAVLRKASGRFSDTRGYAQLSGGAGARQTGLATESDLGTAFAVATSMFGENDLIVSGNLGYGSTSGVPATAFRTSYSRNLGGSKPEVSVTVRQLHMPVAASQAIYGPENEHNGPAIETFTLGFADHVRLGETIRFQYGFLYESVRFLDRLNFVSPYGRLIYQLDKNREIHLRYASGVPNDRVPAREGEASPGVLRQHVSSLGMFPRLSLRNGRPTVQRTEHIEISYREKMGKGLLEVAAYKDSVNDAALSAVAPAGAFGKGELLPDLFSDSSTLNAGDFRSSGYRVSYAHQIRDRLQAAIGVGSVEVISPETSTLGDPAISDLRRSLSTRRARMLTASLTTSLPKADTRLHGSYQWVSRKAVIAPDLYNDFASRSDPGLNLVIRQPLPFSGGLPGKLEATARLSNLLKSGYIPLQTVGGQRVYLFQAVRSYRGALSIIF